MTAFALMLACAAWASWMICDSAASSLRPYLRFAAILYVALAAASIFGLTETVGLIVTPCAVGALTLAALQKFGRTMPIGIPPLALGLAALGGIAAAVSGIDALAFAPLLIAAASLFAIGGGAFREAPRFGVHLMVSALAFIAGASSMLGGSADALWPLMVFSAVGLLGSVTALSRLSDARVDAARRRQDGAVIGPAR